MAEFSYIIRTAKGARETGNITSENYNSALEKLQTDGTTVIELKERDTSFDFIKPFFDRLSIALEELKNKVPLGILVFFTRQLSTMFSAGLTIERALYFLSTEEKNSKFKKVLLKIADDVKKGLLLSSALERHPGVFSNLYISLVKAGEVSGKLSETLEGYDYARDLAIAATRNFTYLRTGSETDSGESLVNIGDTSGVVQGMTVAD